MKRPLVVVRYLVEVAGMLLVLLSVAQQVFLTNLFDSREQLRILQIEEAQRRNLWMQIGALREEGATSARSPKDDAATLDDFSVPEWAAAEARLWHEIDEDGLLERTSEHHEGSVSSQFRLFLLGSVLLVIAKLMEGWTAWKE